MFFNAFQSKYGSTKFSNLFAQFTERGVICRFGRELSTFSALPPLSNKHTHNHSLTYIRSINHASVVSPPVTLSFDSGHYHSCVTFPIKPTSYFNKLSYNVISLTIWVPLTFFTHNYACRVQPTLLGQRHFSPRILHLGLSYDAFLKLGLSPEGGVSTPKHGVNQLSQNKLN